MASPTPCTWVWVNSGSWWWTGRPGVLRFMGSLRVGHDWATELTELNRSITNIKILVLRSFTWRRKWQSIPVFLPGKPHGRRNLAVYSARGHKESDTTKVTYHSAAQRTGISKCNHLKNCHLQFCFKNSKVCWDFCIF